MFNDYYGQLIYEELQDQNGQYNNQLDLIYQKQLESDHLFIVYSGCINLILMVILLLKMLPVRKGLLKRYD